MNKIAEKLLANSLAAILSSIEIYNKPDFKYREEIFTILNINAWELLLKTKILNDKKGIVESLYVMKEGKPKLTRNGAPMTIEIVGAMKKTKIDPVIVENLTRLIEIRDTAVHFYNNDSLSYLIYTLGVASLKNYQMLIKNWFDKSLLEYNFFILPLAFAYNFKTLSLLELDNEPEVISNLIKSVSTTQSSIDPSNDFHFVCEVTTEIQSAKKFMGDPDFTTVIESGTKSGASIVIQTQNLIDKYPISYKELYKKIKKAKPEIKQHELNKFIKDYGIKNNPNFSTYIFINKSKKMIYEKTGVLPKGITSIYNEDSVRYIIENIDGKLISDFSEDCIIDISNESGDLP